MSGRTDENLLRPSFFLDGSDSRVYKQNMPATKTPAPKYTAFRNYAWRETIGGVKQTVTRFYVSRDGVSVGEFNGYGAQPSTRKADAIRRAKLALEGK